MSKDAYYFPHDSNAQHDEKILQLRAKWDWRGYGLYWAIIERLRDCEKYKLCINSIPGLAISLSVAQAELESFLEQCFDVKLFLKDNNFFYSQSLINRMEKYDNTKKRLQEAGRKGGIVSSQAQARLKQPSSMRLDEIILDKSILKNTTLPAKAESEYVCKTDIDYVLYGYKLEIGIPDIPAELRKWDKLNYKRFVKTAKLLMDYFKDSKEVVNCIEFTKKDCENRNISWTLETVAKRINLYKKEVNSD